jgi:hypothetical protein
MSILNNQINEAKMYAMLLFDFLCVECGTTTGVLGNDRCCGE